MTRIPTSLLGPMASACALTCATALLPCAAWALPQAYATATLGQLQYTLTDLDPNDGIAPSITWAPGQVDQSVWAGDSYGADAGGPALPYVYQRTASQADPLDAIQSLGYSGYTVSATPDSQSLQVNTPEGAGGSWYLWSTHGMGFQLSPNTAVTFTAQAHVSLGVTVPSWSVIQRSSGYLDNGYFDWAPMQASAHAFLYIGDSPQALLSSAPIRCWVDGCVAVDSASMSLRSYQTTDRDLAQAVSVTFTNDTAAAAGNQLFGMVTSEGYATAPLMMVPEASTGAQMLVGLLAVGAVAGLGRRKPVPSLA